MSDLKNKQVMQELAECLDIPESAYEKAEARYNDLGEWFSRPDAHCAPYSPHIYPQGSFRLGTVINADEFDLDFGCRLCEGVTKTTHTQQQLKVLVGLDMEAYRVARGIEQKLEEKNRCWRLKYKDELAFHMDGVPSIPQEEYQRVLLSEAMVNYGAERVLAESVAEHAGAITDNRLPTYTQLSPAWKISNSEGYAKWFEAQMKLSSEFVRVLLSETKAARIDDLPTHKWKSPLQRSVQILKCHRDHMFEETPESKPISIILTTLAAQAYQGEQDVTDALEGILSRMGSLVRSDKPRVPNPVNPSEDFADKWYDPAYKDLNLEANFFAWLRQAKIDFDSIRGSSDPEFISQQARVKFGATLPASIARSRLGSTASAVVVPPKVHLITERPPEPWMRG